MLISAKVVVLRAAISMDHLYLFYKQSLTVLLKEMQGSLNLKEPIF